MSQQNESERDKMEEMEQLFNSSNLDKNRPKVWRVWKKFYLDYLANNVSGVTIICPLPDTTRPQTCCTFDVIYIHNKQRLKTQINIFYEEETFGTRIDFPSCLGF